MAPITNLTNLGIESSFYLGTFTTTQRDAISIIRNGLIIYNTSTNTFQGYENGGWVNITTGGAVVLNAPVLPTANAPVAASGAIYYDSTTHKLTTGIGAAYESIYTSPLAQAGNLVMQSLAADPITGNSVVGEIYYNTARNVIRVRRSTDWETLNTSLQTATGVHLADGSPFTLPDGGNDVEADAGNQVVGFTFYNAPLNAIRLWSNGMWKRVNTDADFVLKRTATAVDHAVLITEVIIGVTNTGAARTITLPTVATTAPGQIFIIKDESGAAATHNITVAGNGGELVDGAASVAIAANYGAVRVYCSGTAWFTF